VALFLAVAAGPLTAAELFRDDFSRYPAGWLSQPVGQLNAAIQEYHYLSHRGVPLAAWANPIVHDDAWVVSDEDGRSYLEQHRVNAEAAQFTSMMIVGDPEWTDATVEVQVKPLSLGLHCGLVFRYHTNRHHYLLALDGGQRLRLAVRQPFDRQFRVAEWREIAEAPFTYDVRRYYALKVENDGPRIRAFVDGRLVLEASDGEILKGKAGVAASSPARFAEFVASAPDAVAEAIRRRIADRESALERLRQGYPRPKLWKTIATSGYGAGRNLRFGDLDGDGRTDILIGQNIPRVRGDAFDHISALTAVDLDGRVLWRLGRTDPRNTLLTNDTPFQIHDLDGDGRKEVVLVRDFQLQALDGATGRLLRKAWMPPMDVDLKERPYELNSGDSIAFLDLTGKGRREILVKDRYRSFWVYSSGLELLWKGTGLTGHYPYPFDVDGDGREEIALGYALWGGDGRQLWSRDADFMDHADGVAVGNFSGDPAAEPRVYACGSDEGFLLFDRAGRLLKQLRIGHAQSPTIARYRGDLPGLQLLTVNYWRNPGILSLFDHDGNLLKQEEPIHSGSPLLPVNWRGDGQELAMLSGHPSEGGLIDGELRRVVMFPEDGHPDLAYAVADLTGDPRDEIVLWDTERIWIYTQDQPFEGRRIYAPVRNPEANESNYRTTVSLPAWKDLPRQP
jgi:rhamnogalacturonan endolyase